MQHVLKRLVLLVGILIVMPQFLRADTLQLVAGGATAADNVPAVEAKLREPFGVDFDRDANLYLVELGGGRVCRIDGRGIFTILGGTAQKGYAGDGGPVRAAVFNGMHSLVIGPNGDIYIADTWNNVIRKLDPKTGEISAFVGTGKKGFQGDGGPARDALCGGIFCVALDPAGTRLYFADLDNRRIRAVDLKTGIIDTVAGNGQAGVPVDGTDARQAPLVDPRAVAVDDQRNVYILERGGHALRVVGDDGKIRTLAGTGKRGLSGDGGPAREATLNGPKHLCIDLHGDVIIADTENHVIRKYSVGSGQITRIAGTGKKGSAGVGKAPLDAEFNQPHGVTFDRTGTLYIVDSSNHRVLKIVP